MKKTHSVNMLIDADLNLMQSRAEEASRRLKALGNAQRLRDEGLVSTRREAQSVRYALPEGPAQVIIATLYHIYCAADVHRRTAKTARRTSHTG